MKLTINYTIFAILASVANIGSQDITIRIYGGIYPIAVSILVGTLVGLVIKYILDKKYIFKYQTRNLSHNTITFVLYTTSGVITTAIFWGVEFAFEYMFQTKAMRYTGGFIGLAIGYILKYQLDKRYVFSKSDT